MQWHDTSTVVSVEQCRRLSTVDLNHARVLRAMSGTRWRAEWFNPGRQRTGSAALRVVRINSDFHLDVAYYMRDEANNNDRLVKQRISVVSIPSKVGQQRFMFVCPGRKDHPCGRTIRDLYIRPHSPGFACRHCHKLGYEVDRRPNRRLRWPSHDLKLTLTDESFDDIDGLPDGHVLQGDVSAISVLIHGSISPPPLRRRLRGDATPSASQSRPGERSGCSPRRGGPGPRRRPARDRSSRRGPGRGR
jgi:hypothetical protein